AILTFDPDGVMRFKAWRGLSDRYRAAVEGHSPWTQGAKSPRPVVVSDIDADQDWAPFRKVFHDEGIGALGFVPLVAGGGLLGEVLDEVGDAHPGWSLRLESTGNAEGTWDGDRLGQVFSNLIGNAVQHGAPSHGVRVRVDGTDRESVRVEVQNMGVVPADLLP